MLIFAGMEPEADSDREEEPAHLLTAWLGELDTLKKVNNCPGCQIGDQAFYITPLLLQGLDSQQTKNNSGYGTVVRRDRTRVDKSQYRCSLIHIEHSQDDELDAILGELSELETQFSKEITIEERKRSSDESSRDYSIIGRLPSGTSREGGTVRNCEYGFSRFLTVYYSK